MFTGRIDALDNGLALTPPSKSFYVDDHTQLAFDKLQRAPIVPSNKGRLRGGYSNSSPAYSQSPNVYRLTGTFEF